MKHYYGYITNGWGFVDEEDPRHEQEGLIELTEEEYSKLFDEQIEGKQIVCYNGKVFAAEPLYYYIDENNEWKKRSKREVEKIIAQQRQEQLAKLSLTKREVFLALYKDKGITPEQIKGSITDPEALIEFEYATEYFRGNPLIDAIGKQLGYSSDDLDYLFENGELKTIEN